MWPEAWGEAVLSRLETARRPTVGVATPSRRSKRAKVGRVKAGAIDCNSGPSSVGGRGKPVQLPMRPPRRAREMYTSRAC